jgi:hypothetical protein
MKEEQQEGEGHIAGKFAGQTNEEMNEEEVAGQTNEEMIDELDWGLSHEKVAISSVLFGGYYEVPLHKGVKEVHGILSV